MVPGRSLLSLVILLQVSSSVKIHEVRPLGCDFRKGGHARALSTDHKFESPGSTLLFRRGQDECNPIPEISGHIESQSAGSKGFPTKFASHTVLAPAEFEDQFATRAKAMDGIRLNRKGNGIPSFQPCSDDFHDLFKTLLCFRQAGSILMLPAAERGGFSQLILNPRGVETRYGLAFDVPLGKVAPKESQTPCGSFGKGLMDAGHKAFSPNPTFNEAMETVYQLPKEQPKAKEYLNFFGDFETGDQ